MAKRPEYPWGEIRVAVAGGLMTLREAAERWQVPFGTLAARCHREGWNKTGDANKLANTAPAIADIAHKRIQGPSGPALGDIMAATREECRERIRNAAGRVVAKGLEGIASQDATFIVSKADKIKALVDAGGKATGFGEDPAGGVNLSMAFNFLDEQHARQVEGKVIDVEVTPAD
jgi:hypothetical protein